MDFDLERLFFSVFAVFAIQVVFAYYIYIISEVKDYKKSGVLVIIITLTSSILLYLDNLNPENPIILLSKLINILVINSILLMLIYKFKAIKSIIYLLIWAVIVGISATLLQFIQSMLGVSYFLVKSDMMGNIISHFSIIIMTFIVVIIFKYILITYKSTNNIPSEIKSRAIIINILFLVIIASIITVSNMYTRKIDDLSITKVLFFFDFCMIFALLVFSLFNLKTFCNLENTNNELEHQKFYNKNLQEFLDDVRSFKHNYNNLLSVMSGYKSLKKWEQLAMLIEEEIRKSNSTSVNDSLLSCDIKNAGLLGLISSKMKYSLTKDAPIQLRTSGKIDEINVKMSLICEVLGILLDNAIEAANESPSKLVILTTKNENNRMHFIIENSYGQEINIHNIFKKGNSSKGKGRGLGLWIVNERVSKNKKLILNTSNESFLFKQELIVYNDKKL